MGTLPRNSSPTMTTYMQGLKIKDKTEKGLMVRIGTLMDGVVNAQRGHGNAGATLNRRSQKRSIKTPPSVSATTDNVFDGASVVIDPLKSSSNLSNYEVQLADDAGFSDPITKLTFNKNIIFKGLTAGTTYHLRVRGLTKSGEVGPWKILDPVTTTTPVNESGADFDGQVWLGNLGGTGTSKTFSFNFASESLFSAANFGLTNVENNPPGVLSQLLLYQNGVSVIPAVDTGQNLIQILTFLGVNLTPDTSGVTYSTGINLIRYWPIGLFTIWNPVDGWPNDSNDTPAPGTDVAGAIWNPDTIWPASHLYITGSSQEGGITGSFGPTVWVKF